MCSTVQFDGVQIREIRKRIAGAASIDEALAMFKLPKVTRYRTFTRVDTYRVRDCVVEFEAGGGAWKRSGYGDGSVEAFAKHMARFKDWTALAALADVAARPTEEVDA